jgi:hypothetical protein
MREIFENMRDAFENCVARYTIGFVFPFQGPPHLDVAAGVAVKWNGRCLIVTARHVLKEEDFDGVHLILPLDQPFGRGGPIVVPKKTHPMVEMPVPKASFVQCEWEDLGYFEVASNFGGSSDLDFYPLPPLARTPGSNTGCVLMGFPRDLSGPLSRSQAAAVLAARWSSVHDVGEEAKFLKPFAQNNHFLMKFHAADKGKSAEGFSGGGVWFLIEQPGSETVWRPTPGLAGIQSKWFSKKSITLAVRVELLVRFLSESIGAGGDIG